VIGHSCPKNSARRKIFPTNSITCFSLPANCVNRAEPGFILGRDRDTEPTSLRNKFVSRTVYRLKMHGMRGVGFQFLS
jgi:hypothetical protein